MNDLAKTIEEVGEAVPFGPNTEKAIVSLVFDKPEFFTSIIQYLSHKFFRTAEARYVIGIVEKLYAENDVVPPRNIVKDFALRALTVEDDYEPIIKLIDRPTDHKELPFIKKELLKWARDRAFGMLYSDDGLNAYEAQDYEKLEEIFEQAKRITDVSDNGLFFFNEPDLLFKKDLEKKYTSGFSKLDLYLNEGGPTKKEVLCWMAGTGVGKSILLPHAGMANVKRGCKVLHITLELSKVKTALRYAGGLANVEVSKRYEIPNRKKIMEVMEKAKKTYGGDLAIYEFSPNEISIHHLKQLIDQLRKSKNWNPDVLVIDYLELLTCTKEKAKSDEYLRQKMVATEVRQLARNEELLIFTATQTGRDDPKAAGKGAGGPQVAGTGKVAESYGKLMPMDYVISANQEMEEYNSDTPQLRLFIAKNRNGPKNKTIPVNINYNTFKMEEKVVSKVLPK